MLGSTRVCTQWDRAVFLRTLRHIKAQTRSQRDTITATSRSMGRGAAAAECAHPGIVQGASPGLQRSGAGTGRSRPLPVACWMPSVSPPRVPRPYAERPTANIRTGMRWRQEGATRLHADQHTTVSPSTQSELVQLAVEA